MRKQLLFIFLVLFASQTLFAQSTQYFRPFNLRFGLGAAGTNKGMGLTASAEASYSFAGIATGIKLEQAHMYMKDVSSYALTIDKYLAKGIGFRPFVGGGLGLYTVTESGGCSAGPGGLTAHDTDPFGGFLRAGFDAAHFRLSFEYNFVADTHVRGFDSFGKLTGESIYKSDFFSVKASIAISGGKRHKNL